MSVEEAGAYNCATEKTMRFAFLPAAVLLSCSILGSGFPTLAQNRGNNNSHFYDGARRGSQGGNYGGGTITITTTTTVTRAASARVRVH